jgi:hypothetical protein
MVGTQIWQLSNELIQEPESTHYVASENAIFVANIVGGELDKDGEGWISKISPDGELIEGKWVEGLNAPHGMRVYGGQLWVADIDELVSINLDSATVTKRIPIPGSELLNDLAIANDGTIFVSDILANEIYQVTQEGDVSIFAPGVEKEYPNGLVVQGDKLLVAAWGNIVNFDTFETDVPGHVYQLDLNSGTKTLITPEPLGILDGIEFDREGNLLVTDFFGKLYLVDPESGAARDLALDLDFSADIGVIPEQNIVIIPDFDQIVQAFEYDTSPAIPRTIEDGGMVYDTNPAGENTVKTTLSENVLDLGLDGDYDNLVGFYEVTSLNGAIDTNNDGVEDLLPGIDNGYAQAVLTNAIPDWQIRVGSQGNPDLNTTVEEFGDIVISGGKMYAPFAIAHGGAIGVDGFIAAEVAETDGIFNNAATNVDDLVAYFAYPDANPDGAIHIQAGDNNVFGFEDLPANLNGVSDNDFNDAVFKFDFAL